uniref:Movement protein n=1 Tax=Pea early browning virus TaxID=12294 RepID=A0A8F8QUF2_PEBV|nr:movement protein [Pea early-browning virus]
MDIIRAADVKTLNTLKEKTFNLTNFSNLNSWQLMVDGARKRPKYFHRRRETVLSNVAGSLTEHKLGIFTIEDVRNVKNYKFLRIVGIQIKVTSHLPRDTTGFLQIDLIDSRLTDGRKRSKVLQRFVAKACDNTSVVQYKFDYCVSTRENIADLWKIGTVAVNVPVVDDCYPFSVEVSMIWVATDSTTRLNVEELNQTDYLEGEFSDQEMFDTFMDLKHAEMKSVDVKFKGNYLPKASVDRNISNMEKIPDSIKNSGSIKKRR